MSTGPIEFGDEVAHEVPATEMGGADGLIQPAVVDAVDGGVVGSGGLGIVGHDDEALTGGEILGMMRRAGGVVGSYAEQTTGVADSEDIVDPVSGRAVPVRRNGSAGGVGDTGLSDQVRPAGA